MDEQPSLTGLGQPTALKLLSPVLIFFEVSPTLTADSAAVIVKDGQVIAAAGNSVIQDNAPSAHA